MASSALGRSRTGHAALSLGQLRARLPLHQPQYDRFLLGYPRVRPGCRFTRSRRALGPVGVLSLLLRNPKVREGAVHLFSRPAAMVML
jgi:hypothetical protein